MPGDTGCFCHQPCAQKPEITGVPDLCCLTERGARFRDLLGSDPDQRLMVFFIRVEEVSDAQTVIVQLYAKRAVLPGMLLELLLQKVSELFECGMSDIILPQERLCQAARTQ